MVDWITKQSGGNVAGPGQRIGRQSPRGPAFLRFNARLEEVRHSLEAVKRGGPSRVGYLLVAVTAIVLIT